MTTTTRPTAAAAIVAAVAALLLTGCGDPCADLSAPSEAEIAAAAEGAEVEVEVESFGGETECVVERGQWVEGD